MLHSFEFLAVIAPAQAIFAELDISVDRNLELVQDLSGFCDRGILDAGDWQKIIIDVHFTHLLPVVQGAGHCFDQIFDFAVLFCLRTFVPLEVSEELFVFEV